LPEAAGASAKSGSSKAWMVLAGVVGFVVIAGAAAWQFAGKRDPTTTDPTLGVASAPVATPTVPVAALPVPTPTAPTTTAVPAATTTENAATSPTTTATTLPEASRPVPVPSPTRPPTTAARTDVPADTGSKPPLPDRTTAATNTFIDRSTSAASSAASLARARPVGQPVPRQRDTETAATGTPTYPSRPPEPSTGYNNGNTNNPPPSSYNTGNPNDRPRPLGQSNVRDPVVVGRPVPQPQQQAPQYQQPQQQAAQAQPTSARDACGKRVFIALALCMEEKCDEARFRGTAECVAILDRKRARENR
jgi:hypothetical protein